MSDLVGNPEDRFSRVEAHLLMAVQQYHLAFINRIRSCIGKDTRW